MNNKLQPTRTTFSIDFQYKKVPGWRSKFFYFGTENGEDHLKNHPIWYIFMMRPFWCFTVDINSSLSSFDTISATGASENAQDTTWVTQFHPNITGKHKIRKCHCNCLRFSFKPESHKKNFEKRQNMVPGYQKVRVSFLTILKEASDSCGGLCNCSINSARESQRSGTKLVLGTRWTLALASSCFQIWQLKRGERNRFAELSNPFQTTWKQKYALHSHPLLYICQHSPLL